MRFPALPSLLTTFLTIVLAACDGADAKEGAASKDGSASRPAPARTARAPGAIAYVTGDGQELRLVMPDGSGGRTLWRAPDTLYSVTAPAWRPDGSEVAFASDHEMAYSFYQRDVYAVGADGAGLRKVTNPPLHEEAARLPKGTVTVTVQNLSFEAGPFFVYVEGAPEPKLETLAPGSSTRLVFRDVADLGEGVNQPVVVVSGLNRWWDAAAAPDVKAGGSVEAPPLALGASPFERFGADVPLWRADGSRLGFILLPTCLLQHVPADPPPGPSYEPLLDPEVFGSVCAVDWGPTPALARELLVLDTDDFTLSGTSHVLRVREGAREKPAPVASFDEYVRVFDLRWLPDGSGFVVARQDGLTDEDVNLYEFTFATRQQRKITDFTGEMVRRFSLSPDGSQIAFERVTGSIYELATLPSDLWIVGRDGSGLRPLAKDAAFPAWNPQR